MGELSCVTRQAAAVAHLLTIVFSVVGMPGLDRQNGLFGRGTLKCLGVRVEILTNLKDNAF